MCVLLPPTQPPWAASFGTERRFPRNRCSDIEGLAKSPISVSLYLCKLLGLLSDHRVNFLDVLVGQLLQLVFALVQLVLGDFALLLRSLELIQRVAADVAQRNLGLLAGLGHAL